jgi:hypothetical protein
VGAATGTVTDKSRKGYAAGDPDLYGYCLDDPVNAVDPTGMQGEDAGKRIVRSGVTGGLKGAAVGFAAGGLPMAAVGGVAGLSSGLFTGTVKEIPVVRRWIDKTKSRLWHEATDGKAERMQKHMRHYSYEPWTQERKDE